MMQTERDYGGTAMDAQNTKGPARRGEKAKRSRQMLLDAAARLFSERNINEVGVREISAAAGVTTGTFYHYFESKDDILDKLYLNRDVQFGEALARLAGCPPYTRGILDFFSEVLAAAVEQDGVDFTMHRMFQMKKHSTEENRLYAGVIALLDAAVKNGELKGGTGTREINGYLFLVFRGVVYEWCIAEGGETGFLLRDAVRGALALALQPFR